MLGFKSVNQQDDYSRGHNDLRNFRRSRSRMFQHVPCRRTAHSLYAPDSHRIAGCDTGRRNQPRAWSHGGTEPRLTRNPAGPPMKKGRCRRGPSTPTDRQRQLRVIRHDGQQELPELSRPAGCRSHRLCDQRRRPGLRDHTLAGRWSSEWPRTSGGDLPTRKLGHAILRASA